MNGIDNLHSGSGIDSMSKADIVTITWLDGTVDFNEIRKKYAVDYGWGTHEYLASRSLDANRIPPVNYNFEDRQKKDHYEERMQELGLTILIFVVIVLVYLIAA